MHATPPSSFHGPTAVDFGIRAAQDLLISCPCPWTASIASDTHRNIRKSQQAPSMPPERRRGVLRRVTRHHLELSPTGMKDESDAHSESQLGLACDVCHPHDRHLGIWHPVKGETKSGDALTFGTIFPRRLILPLVRLYCPFCTTTNEIQPSSAFPFGRISVKVYLRL